jgi:ATP-dependent Lhr-like helicase
MNSQVSNSSNQNQVSSAFDKLDRKIQRWIYEKGWTELRQVQETAINSVLNSSNHIVISSPTASGKTEAALLPIFSKIANKTDAGVSVLYISPLKALINDQFERLSDLADTLDIVLTKWHGDANSSAKKKLLKNPSGVLQITPESLESILINHSTKIFQLFFNLDFIVIDELHYFIGNERGIQLLSLISRIEFVTKKMIRRIGLSATIGDTSIASMYLYSKNVQSVEIISVNSLEQEVKLSVKGYLRKNAPADSECLNKSTLNDDTTDIGIVKEIFSKLRGTNNLIFANSRANVEKFSDYLRRECEKRGFVNEFYPHHGNLSKNLREELELELKKSEKPISVVCTSTLELGIDIGNVHSVAQINSPPNVASLRQRLGRSGRRGEPAILRLFMIESELTSNSDILIMLRAELIKSIAIIELLKVNWYESSDENSLHLSTLLQQILAIICQFGEIPIFHIWSILVIEGPFTNVSKELFTEVIRRMGELDLVSQRSQGNLIIGSAGEKIVNYYEFYTVFVTPQEYKVIHGNVTLGSLPFNQTLTENNFIIFAGRRWQIISVEVDRKCISVIPAKGGKLLAFNGSEILISQSIREKMKAIYNSNSIPEYLDDVATKLYKEGVAEFHRLRLEDKWIVQDGGDTLLLIWSSDIVVQTIALLLKSQGYSAEFDRFIIRIHAVVASRIMEVLQYIVEKEKHDISKLLELIKDKRKEKYDYLLSESLLDLQYSSTSLNIEESVSHLRKLLEL